MRYRFSDADRERLGISSEWVELDLERLMLDEAMGLEEAGYDVDEFLDDYRGYPLERNGKPVMVDVVDDTGALVLEDGKPVQVQQRRRPAKAIGAAAWIAARRGGATVSFVDFTYDMFGLEVKAGTQGKDDSSAPAFDS